MKYNIKKVFILIRFEQVILLLEQARIVVRYANSSVFELIKASNHAWTQVTVYGDQLLFAVLQIGFEISRNFNWQQSHPRSHNKIDPAMREFQSQSSSSF